MAGNCERASEAEGKRRERDIKSDPTSGFLKCQKSLAAEPQQSTKLASKAQPIQYCYFLRGRVMVASLGINR